LGRKVQFRSELFNLFNRVQFSPAGNALGRANLGGINSLSNERQLILEAMKFIF
jgi:hypothetical protein